MRANKELLIDDSSSFHKIATETSIEIKDVTVSFKSKSKGTFTAVKDIDLTIEKGEIVSIIGHSGCGKSTLMNTISGMVAPSSGEVIANGKTVTGFYLTVELYFKITHFCLG